MGRMLRRLLRWLTPLLALALAGGAVASSSVAGAAEVGINVAASSGNYFNAPKVREAKKR